MMRFDFLHDAPHPLIEAARRARLPRRLHTVAAVHAMLFCVILFAAIFQAFRIHQAETVEQRAQIRFDRSRIGLEEAQLHWLRLDELIAEDRRLHEVRLSSSKVADRLARTGNLFPERIWLTAMTSDEKNHRLEGRAENLVALDAALAHLLHDPGLGEPQLIRLSRDEQGSVGFMNFEIRLEGVQ